MSVIFHYNQHILHILYFVLLLWRLIIFSFTCLVPCNYSETSIAQVHEFVHVTTERKGWLTDFNLRHNFTSPARIDELVRDLAYHAGSLHTLAKQTMETLKPVFDAHTISEWMEQKLLPLFKLLDHIQTAAQQLRARKYWPTRPLKRFDSWDYYGIKIEEEATSVKPVTYPAH